MSSICVSCTRFYDASGIIYSSSIYCWFYYDRCLCSRRAFGLMFLFSDRGYWQELIESIVWAHNKLKVAPAIQPRDLSITQGRAVGVAHYLPGGIATTWAFFIARIFLWG
ncbi:hypothetical protein Mp_1g16220 [Marchantia polymorpha subsp. ruderalis]|uniref:Photosystem I P700 chlorophyll a apoprotein A1 n=2 Tax=Marchantia polymorpha TaxID=3197 RepID=A0AAF6AQR5_MARPO|nr:hypothetical protein MARPO_0033s0038 [Marchantia polymorpha]BBM98785.1 hypothetical protein Mp_1g16220 [Marchantia polymorpha subsp. ruderalis]|eukprot:PTQ41618.1 hypothetical protein MARPO_0033s0038 [Marchantia polymorpha]